MRWTTQPPRKGCDEPFLKQLIAFGPQSIVYVSCNVHTQARDVGYFIDATKGRYELESLRGFDLFPQVSFCMGKQEGHGDTGAGFRDWWERKEPV
jgi:tRNA (uracil-5-)-methyltransferase